MTTTRSIERELFIAAQPEQVWQALTEAEHLRSWFAPHAQTTPGVGGYIHLGWDVEAQGPGNHCVITTWEPNEHLVMSWRDAPDGEHPLPVEIVLQAKDGGTLLRLTHSGFLSDASWDDEFDSHGRGWTYELRSLRYYLEAQFGRARAHLMRRFPLTGPHADSWSQLVGEAGLFRVAHDAAEAAEVLMGLPTGESSRARILHGLTDKDFAAVLQVLGGGVVRIAFETFAGTPEIWFWVFSWQYGEAELERLTAPWFQAVAERLSPGSSFVPPARTAQ